MNKVIINDFQRRALEKLWFVYGNNGKKSTHMNHRFIQNLLQHGEDDREFYLEGPKNMREKGIDEETILKQALTQECIEEVDKILNEKTINNSVI